MFCSEKNNVIVLNTLSNFFLTLRTDATLQDLSLFYHFTSRCSFHGSFCIGSTLCCVAQNVVKFLCIVLFEGKWVSFNPVNEVDMSNSAQMCEIHLCHMCNVQVQASCSCENKRRGEKHPDKVIACHLIWLSSAGIPTSHRHEATSCERGIV